MLDSVLSFGLPVLHHYGKGVGRKVLAPWLGWALSKLLFLYTSPRHKEVGETYL